MRDFSIDKSAEKIKINETKENFKEVLSCYYNENYRATIVLLYSVVITDILFKLKNLEENYNDMKAISILNSIKTAQENSPTSPQWEDDLIDKVENQTNLIDLREKGFINNLKKLRHLCAHPVLADNYNLFNPNKETVTAHLRNMLECVLLKPSFFSRVIFEDFILDLANVKSILIDEKSIQNYIGNKYIENFDDLTLSSVFKNLWRISLNSDSEEAEENRSINVKGIVTLLKSKHDVLLKYVEKEVTYFSKINLNYFSYFVDVFNRFPKIYEVLDLNIKTLITDILKKNYKKRFVSFFDIGLEKHIEYLFSTDFSSDYPDKYPLQNISSYNIIYISKFLNNSNNEKRNDFIIKIYTYTSSFESAKERYRELIEPHIESFSENQLRNYLDVSNKSHNIYDSFGVNFSDAKQLIARNGYDIKFADFINLN